MKSILFNNFCHTTGRALLLLALFAGQFDVRANPTGGTVASGAATFNTTASQLTIHQTSGSAFINWQSFNIGSGETTTFVQSSSTSVAWNQINDVNPSQILGNLNANGYVFLQNQNGFYVGGQASITAHGLIMTTAAIPAPNLSSGGTWSFNAPPPTAKIINYGQIHTIGGGPAFLIASDIVNNGTISAPGGKTGLYAGEKVLVSMSPDGRGLSAEVTLPTGSVDNQGNLTADAGSIAAQAKLVNQGGLIQANSVRNINGTIELVASDSVNLGSSSIISAQGANAGTSAGGSVTLQSGNTFSDHTGSTINISGGVQGGNGGKIEISAPNVLSLNSSINARAQAGWTAGKLLLDPDYIILDTSGSSGAGSGTVSAGDNPGTTLDLNVNSAFANLAVSQIILQAAYDITLAGGTSWNLSGTIGANYGGVTDGQLTLEAGRNINFGNGAQITDANNWSVTLQAGYDFVNNVVKPNIGTIYLNGGSSLIPTPAIQTQNGNITLQAAAIQTQAGDNVALTATDGNIELGSVWTLTDTDPGVAASLNLTAGNSIILDANSGVVAGNNWSLNLAAGTEFVPTTAQPAPASGSDGIYLNDNSYVQTQNGDINLNAANEILIATDVNAGNNGIRTLNEGNIDVTAQYGNVNTGSNPQGFLYKQPSGIKRTLLPPYYSVSTSVGGISTAAGGNVTINAGDNVISYNPSGPTVGGDAGTGAFGSQLGNVTITAGGSIYGHYVLANGVGTITAGNTVGAPSGNNSFALSLIDGTWNVNAPNGNIYLQEVRNPNGVFNNTGNDSSVAAHLFDYGANATVDLTAGNGVYLTGLSLPRLTADAVQVVYPPVLDITAGSGGVTLQSTVTLFPSADQNLNITTTAGGSLVTVPNDPGTTPELLMSDSSQTRWSSSSTFSDTDLGAPNSVEPTGLNPVLLTISGNMENLNLITTKETQITVGGDMTGCGFSGQNLHASDPTSSTKLGITSITVAGQIYNRSPYSFVYGINIPNIPTADLLPGISSSWDNIFTLALNPAALATLNVPANIPSSQLAVYIVENTSLFQTHVLQNGQLLGNNPGFVYNPATGRLGYAGQMSQTYALNLTQPITVLHLVNGLPVFDSNPSDNTPGRSYGQYETDTVIWAPPAEVQNLFSASIGAPSPLNGQLGYRLGGPGEFDINANSISLGNTYGILSCGVADPQGGFARYGNLASLTASGASVNVTVAEDQTVTVNDVTTTIPSLDMLTSTIAAIGGGHVNVTSTGGSMNLGSQELFNIPRQVGLGIFTSGNGYVNVTALGDIDINGSRIAAFNGGEISVESQHGTVNVGSGAASANGVGVSYVDATGQAQFYAEQVFGSGIVALTLINPSQVPGGAKIPGNITVNAPRGDIVATSGGILQEALNGSIAGGPVITLTAGTFPSGTPDTPGYSPGYAGNINLGQSGVIGGTVNLSANGNISGQVISRQNSTINAAQNFTGTLLSAGGADVSAGGTVSGTIVGIGGANVSGGTVSASVLGQNVSVNGGAATSTLGSSANATSSSQSASQQASQSADQQVASTDTGDNDQKNKKKPLIQKTSRVTVLLSAATPGR